MLLTLRLEWRSILQKHKETSRFTRERLRLYPRWSWMRRKETQLKSPSTRKLMRIRSLHKLLDRKPQTLLWSTFITLIS
jgi:hypothetical protein